ncbi:MAG: hypothetical protein QXK88_01375 [Desulfurococcaceae archaeon]
MEDRAEGETGTLGEPATVRSQQDLASRGAGRPPRGERSEGAQASI